MLIENSQNPIKNQRDTILNSIIPEEYPEK